MGKARKKLFKKYASRTPRDINGKLESTSSQDQSSLVRKKHEEVSSPLNGPFQSTDHILLVGEGDFSFSKALLTSYNCTSLVATSYDSRPVVFAKYPQAVSNIGELEAEQQRVLFEVDATKIGTARAGSGGKFLKKAKFDKIVFQFPHVGGKTTDVSRQVRYNQELLQGFFKAAVPLLAPMGLVVVTLFEGKPYEAWDLKGLAKDAGLKSRRSFRFDSQRYPGYKHSRTLGNIEGGRGWKGEERLARTYLLERSHADDLGAQKEGGARREAANPNLQAITNIRSSPSKKRKREQTDSDSD